MSTRVTVSNLNRRTTANDLHGLFNRSGLVLSVSVSDDSAHTGIVDMSTPEAAATAVNALNGSTLHDHQINVRVA
jgi:RNA recognition motif-containing protein